VRQNRLCGNNDKIKNKRTSECEYIRVETIQNKTPKKKVLINSTPMIYVKTLYSQDTCAIGVPEKEGNYRKNISMKMNKMFPFMIQSAHRSKKVSGPKA
jgi:hypothetical protein